MHLLPWEYFTDAILRAPTLGSMLMCLASSLVGTLTFLKKRSLLGESLAHASYPGVILAVICTATLFSAHAESLLAISVLVGALLSSFLGLWVIDRLERHLRVSSDTALCFVLAAFFGIGITLASRIQFTHTALYRYLQTFLFGQAATMTDTHIVIYGLLSVGIILAIVLFYKEFQVCSFDRVYAKSLGVRVSWIDMLNLLLMVLAIVVGIRSVGFVLVSAMLIAPAAAARQFTHHLHKMFFIAACFGLLSGFLGNVLSVEISQIYRTDSSGRVFSLPTGPMIVLVASTLCLLSLLFAPERGWVIRVVRMARFRWTCTQEKLLKALWRLGSKREVSLQEILRQHCSVSPFFLRLVVWQLVMQGWLLRNKRGLFRLTKDGHRRGERIAHLHQLWEVYLIDYLGMGVERVHRSAEEMEHILTPEVEEELLHLSRERNKVEPS